METQKKAPESDAVTLADYLRFIRERWWVILLVTVILVGVTAGLTFRQTPRYQTSAEVIHQTAGWESTLLGVSSYYYYQQRIPVDARLMASPELAAKVKERTGSARSAAELLGMISVEPLSETESIRVRAVSTDPAEAAAVANGFADTFVATRADDMKQALADARESLEEQLAAVPIAELGEAEGLSLQNRLRQLDLVEDLAMGDYKLLVPAAVPGAPYTPQPIRDMVLALAIGLVGGVALAFVLEQLDKRIRDEESMERVFHLPVLASIPLVSAKAARRRSKTPVPETEAEGKKGAKPTREAIGIGFQHGHRVLLEPYMMLRSNLQYFSVDRDMRMLMITSTLPKQGKTTVTVNLGLALALAGHRVLLMECDLRRPMLHEYLGLSNDVGLSNVLAGTVSFSRALQPVKVADYVSRSSRRGAQVETARRHLYALCSGPIPPNPSELVASKRMEEVLLQAARSQADYILIDTPPVLMVADALAITPQVDGVLIAARLRQTKRDEAAHLRNLLERSGAHVLGLVVGSDKRSRGGYYHYGYGYGGYGYGEAEAEAAEAEAASTESVLEELAELETVATEGSGSEGATPAGTGPNGAGPIDVVVAAGTADTAGVTAATPAAKAEVASVTPAGVKPAVEAPTADPTSPAAGVAGGEAAEPQTEITKA